MTDIANYTSEMAKMHKRLMELSNDVNQHAIDTYLFQELGVMPIPGISPTPKQLKNRYSACLQWGVQKFSDDGRKEIPI